MENLRFVKMMLVDTMHKIMYERMNFRDRCPCL